MKKLWKKLFTLQYTRDKFDVCKNVAYSGLIIANATIFNKDEWLCTK